jgi:hypothetical protein
MIVAQRLGQSSSIDRSTGGHHEGGPEALLVLVLASDLMLGRR